MSPENQWLEDVFPTEIVPFRGHLLVFGGADLYLSFSLELFFFPGDFLFGFYLGILHHHETTKFGRIYIALRTLGPCNGGV